MGGAPAGAGDFSEAGARMARHLSAFMRTLQENAFAAGLKESADAALVLASPLAARPASLRSALKALVCTRRSDWQKFDAVFDAFWLGRGVRGTVRIAGDVGGAHGAERRQLGGPAAELQHQPGLGEQVPGGDDGAGREGGPPGRMEGASRAERLAETDFRRSACAPA
jgi:uncharacterized protein with von Willebrand factor type A (vWA) domain